MTSWKPYILLFIGLTFLFAACGQKPSEIHLPNELAGVKLVQNEKNEAAVNKLKRMHHGVDFADYQSEIGTYRDDANEIKVYVTSFKSKAKSGRMMSVMVENVKAGQSPEFFYVEQIVNDGRVIHVAQSDSLFSYFFWDGKQNIWITAPASRGEEVLNDFLKKFRSDR